MIESEDSPEFDFILHCLRLDAKPGTPGLKPAAAMDWQKWHSLVLEHGVLPQVYKRLEDRGIEGLPPGVTAEIKKILQSNAARNIALCEELAALRQKLRPHSPSLLVYKGPVTAILAYGDPLARVYSDLDLWVLPGDFPELYEHIEAAGYRPLLPLNREKRRWWAYWGREFVFQKGKVFLDIHFRFQRGPALGSRWNAEPANRQSLDLMGRGLEVPAPGDYILALCLNAAKDGWDRLVHLVDLAYLVKNHPPGDWQALVSRARRMGAKTRLFTGLLLARRFLGLELPGKVANQVQAHKRAVKAAGVFSRSLTASKENRGKWSRLFMELRWVDTWWGRTRTFVYYLCVPKYSDLKTLALPAALFPLYLVLRPVFLALRAVRIK